MSRTIREFRVPLDQSTVEVHLQGEIVGAALVHQHPALVVYASHNDRNQPPKRFEGRAVMTGQPWPEDDPEVQAEWDSPKWLWYATATNPLTGEAWHLIGRYVKA